MLVSFLVLADGADLLEVHQVREEHSIGVGLGLGPAKDIVELVDGFGEAARGRQVGVVLNLLPQVKQLSGEVDYYAFIQWDRGLLGLLEFTSEEVRINVWSIMPQELAWTFKLFGLLLEFVVLLGRDGDLELLESLALVNVGLECLSGNATSSQDEQVGSLLVVLHSGILMLLKVFDLEYRRFNSEGASSTIEDSHRAVLVEVIIYMLCL